MEKLKIIQNLVNGKKKWQKPSILTEIEIKKTLGTKSAGSDGGAGGKDLS